MKAEPITIIGGGLAGCEAAGRIAAAGLPCRLLEMKPLRFSPAHQSENLAELVCSNSFKSESLTSAHGLLKAEMKLLGSLVLRMAEETRVPAGQALAVDRERFAERMTRAVENLPGVEIIRGEATAIPGSGRVIIATGPLTSEALAQSIRQLTHTEALSFYDAIAPIVTAESVDFTIAFRASRYEQGGDDYINCPLTREEYDRFCRELLAGRRAPLREFETPQFFEGCLPIEVMAERGPETLAFGPMKPVGLIDPRTGRRPYAIVQLRQDDLAATLYNLVGFQTRLAYPEQERIFRLIPGLEQAEFARLGSIHRNTFIHSPSLLNPDLSLRSDPRIFFAGQITGVEGYLESAAAGIMAGIAAARQAKNLPPLVLPAATMIGALIRYVTNPRSGPFQPMNSNFGILDPLSEPAPKSQRKTKLIERALNELQSFKLMVPA